MRVCHGQWYLSIKMFIQDFCKQVRLSRNHFTEFPKGGFLHCLGFELCRLEFTSCFHIMKGPGEFLLLNEMLVHYQVEPSINFVAHNYTPGQREAQ